MSSFRMPIFPLANLILAHRIMILLIFTKPSHSKWKVLHFAQKMGIFSKEKSAKFVHFHMQGLALLFFIQEVIQEELCEGWRYSPYLYSFFL